MIHNCFGFLCGLGKMANKGTVSSEVADTTCHICLEQYKIPKLLPCGHSFCLQCLVKIDEANTKPRARARGYRLTVICCPECRTNHNISNGPSSLMTDYTMVWELQTLAWRAGLDKRRSVCGGCPDGRGCSCFCVDCDDFLCSVCVQPHKRMKNLAKHKLIDVKDLATVKPTPEPTTCAYHPSLLVSMYCSTCSLLICTDCIASTSHSTHTLHTLTADILKSVEQKLDDLIQNTDKAVSQRVQRIDEINNAQETMKENPMKLKQAIDEIADKCLLAVEQLRANAHAQVDQKLATSLEKSNEQKQMITGELNTLKSCIRFVRKTLSCHEPAARTAMVAKAASVLSGVTVTSTEVSAIVPLFMAVNDIESMFQSETLVSEFNPSKIKVTGWTHSTVRNQMVIQVTIPVVPPPKAEFRVEYSSFRRELPLKEVKAVDSKTWRLEFTPCYIGYHYLKVKLFDQWLDIPTSSPRMHRTHGDLIKIGGFLRKGDIVRPLTKDNTGDSKVGRIGELRNRPSKRGSANFYTMDITWNYDTDDSVLEENYEFSYSEGSGYLPFELVFS
ncbi:E3 ubiquitin-protein ligase TRIM56-like [Halichondria panicea]|uniref:E3 ubiquitin-protein ligase TRIM56-like n=1 Tax=Halichondria panicea TaxID=6063 RepID=UPI00312B7D65